MLINERIREERHRGRSVIQAPPLWAWLAIGFGVDGIGLAGLFQLAARLPHDAVFLNLLSSIFSLLFVAWMFILVTLPVRQLSVPDLAFGVALAAVLGFLTYRFPPWRRSR